MPNAVNLDRGVLTMRMPAIKGGMYVHMYFDDPGVYFNDYGTPVPEALARMIGFDTLAHKRQRIMKEKMKEFKNQMERELQIAAQEPVVVEEANGFRVIEMPGGNADLLDPEGNKVNQTVIKRDEALELLHLFTAADESEEVEALAPAKKAK